MGTVKRAARSPRIAMPAGMLRVMPAPEVRTMLMPALAWLRERAGADAVLQADSRRITPGDVFMAYAVEGADSRPFIADALVRGAAAVLWQTDGFDWPTGVSDANALGITHLDVLAGSFASLWHDEPSEHMTVAGVTGTNGKTSCALWLAQLLEAAGRRCAVVGTLGSGFPDALQVTGFTTPDAVQLQQRLAGFRAQGASAVSMEVSSHGLYQGRVNGVAFDVAIFTNLTQDHLDYHRTMAAYEAAKTRLFDWPGLRCAVINRDDAMGRRLIARLGGKTPVIEYGLSAGHAPLGHGNRTLAADDIQATPSGTSFTLHADGTRVQLHTGLLGTFNVSNLLAVLGAALACGMPLDDAVAGLQRLQPVTGRMQRLGGGAGQPLVVVDYAHTPDALEKTLAALRPVADVRRGRLLCVFGCGGDRDATKRPLMGAVAERLADGIVLTSDNPRHEAPMAIIAQIAAGLSAPGNARQIEDRASALLQTVRGAQPEDVILIAGKGHETTQDIMGKKRPFSDQEHAQLALAARATSRGGGE